ncbi:MAG TPA: hypothetical protein PL188_07660 [Candidatus Cloacimonadota bacterium]|nr:hypothetical protein [Candidatus Cloacimonadota bacterium]
MSRRVVSSKWGWSTDSEAKRFRVTSEYVFERSRMTNNTVIEAQGILNLTFMSDIMVIE